MDRSTPVHLAGSSASLVRPFGNVTGVWAMVCGALAGSQGALQRADLLPLLYVALLVSLGWVAAWRLITETDWFDPLRSGWPPQRQARLPAPPYAQPRSPAGRLWRGVNRLLGWWDEVFWPVLGGAAAAAIAAIVLALLLSVLLYSEGRPAQGDVRLLGAAFVALAGVGLAWRWHGRDWLAGRALALVALPWLAGHLAVAELAAGSALLALVFTLAAWGGERLARSLGGGGWLIVTAEVGVVALLVGLKQPLAAGATGGLVLGQLALLPAAAAGSHPERAARQARLWLLATMLAAAVGLP
ncbi:MAG: hypothetical protein JXA93_11265 [Anaerolineae bacterium]|nr:hypothetical protein [Anaerolineae bacterium]